MIELNGVSKIYQNGVKALDDVNLNLPESGFLIIQGKSGSGKTTLLNILAGIDNPTMGVMSVDSEEITENNSQNYRRNSVSFVFQDFQLLEELTVGDNILLAAELVGRRSEIDLSVILSSLGLDGYADRYPNELSGGQAQRVAIARALVKNNAIIFADEPTGNLDSENGTAIFELLKEISKNRLVVVVTHDDENAKAYADFIVRLKDGRVVENNLPPKIIAQTQARIKKESSMSLKTLAKLSKWSSGKKRGKQIVFIALMSLLIAAVTISYSLLRMDEYTIAANLLHDSRLSVMRVESYINEKGKEILPAEQIKSIEDEYGFKTARMINAENFDFSSETDNFGNIVALNYWKIKHAVFTDDLGEYDIKIIAGGEPKDALDIIIPKTYAEAIVAAGYYQKSRFISRQSDIVKIENIDNIIDLPFYFERVKEVAFTIKGVFDDKCNMPEKYRNKNMGLAYEEACQNGDKSLYDTAIGNFADKTVFLKKAAETALLFSSEPNIFGPKYRFSDEFYSLVNNIPRREKICPLSKYTMYLNDEQKNTVLALNEVIISEYTAQDYGLGVGDEIVLKGLGNTDKRFVIKGLYSKPLGSDNPIYVSPDMFPELRENLGYVDYIFNAKKVPNLTKTLKGLYKFYEDLDDNSTAVKIDSNISAGIGEFIKEVAEIGRIVAVPTFIFSLLCMILLTGAIIGLNIQNKSKEIGVLKSLGAKEREISALFIIRTLFITGIEFFLGAVFGGLGVWGINLFIDNEYRKVSRSLPYGADTFFVALAVIIVVVAFTIAFKIRRLFKKNSAAIIRNQ